jgi:glucokinase
MITRQPWLVVLWASIACIRLVKGWNRGGTVLAADIGGTYTRLSLIEMGKVWRNLSVMRISERYINSNYETLDDIISDFLIKAGPYAKPNGACFAVAGPCMNNVGKLVNGAHGEGEKGGQWVVDGKEIAKRFESLKSVRVINDFVAAGYGILTLNDYEDCVVVHDAPKIRSAPMACIGAGTGLGQCFLIPSGGSSSLSASYDCFPSEGGHAEFAPHNDLEHDLLHYLERKLGGRVSVERVVSGSGIPNVRSLNSNISFF